MRVTYDQARQFGKAYVGALNTSPEAFAALFAPGAEVRVAGAPASPDAVLDATPPGRSGFRRARLDPPDVLLTVRVLDRPAARVDDRVHRLRLDGDGRITALEA
ncbi:MAG TPA: hypothetical protein VK951_10635 [Miltoncostaeaceae bacterium]|nr:hypothetical protein [Miltoncostaeaceae bacterium]